MYPKLVKEIRSKTGELHFKRWRLFSCKRFSLFLHYIAKSDEDKDPHNHPWILRTLILSGGYISENVRYLPYLKSFFNNGECRFRNTIICKPFSRHLVTKSDYHKITLIKPTWSLALVTDDTVDWGYLTKDGHVDSVSYRKLKNELRDKDNRDTV